MQMSVMVEVKDAAQAGCPGGDRTKSGAMSERPVHHPLVRLMAQEGRMVSAANGSVRPLSEAAGSEEGLAHTRKRA